MNDTKKELWIQRSKRIGKGIALLGIVAGMATVIAQAYSGSGIFKPDQFDSTSLQENRVVFQDDKNVHATDEEASGKSDTWDKDQSIQDKLDRSQLPDSSALFERKNAGTKSTNNHFAQNNGSQKMAVNTSGNEDANTNGTIKVPTGNGDGNGDGQTVDQNGPTDQGTKQNNAGQGAGDDQRDNNATTPSVTRTASPSPSDQSDRKDTDHKNDKPERTASPTKKPRPAPPEKDNGLPPGDSLYESMFQITDYPANGVPDSVGSMHLRIIPIFNIEYQSNIYYGAQITADKLLKSALFYVSDENERIRYRLKRYDENFTVTDYPLTATDNFTATFQFRQNSTAAWQETQYTFTVSPYKFFVLNADEELIGDVTPNMDVDPKGNVFNLVPYYEQLLSGEQRKLLNREVGLQLQQYIPGWMDEEGNLLSSDQYAAQQHGWKAFYPLPSKQVPEGYSVQMKWYFDLDHFDSPANLKYLQTLCAIPEGVQDLKVMKGIHWVDLDNVKLQSMQLSATVAAITQDGLTVTQKYQVAEDNPYFSDKDSMLWNKEQTEVIGIPSSVTELDLDERVTKVNLPDKSGIYSITLHSQTPPEMDLSKLSNAIIWVPKEDYDTYLAQWKDELPNTVKLYAEGEEEDKVVRNHAVMSSDGKILYKVLDEVVGTYEVPEGVEVIKENAMSQLTMLHTVILPSTMKAMEKGGLSASSIQRIILLAQNAPVLMQGFERQIRERSSGELYIPKDASYNASTWGKWKVMSTDIRLEESKGFRYIVLGDKRLLLGVPSDLKVYNSQSQDRKIDEIAPGAFSENTSIQVVDLEDGIDTIGSYAFWKCSQLQQILIHEQESLTVMDNAYEGAEHIRAIVSEAKKAEFCNGYNPRYTIFRMMGATGYPDMLDGSGSKSMVMAETVTGFISEQLQEDVYAIYALGQLSDRSYTTLVNVTDQVHGKVQLRQDTEVIEYYAFAGCKKAFTFDFAKHPNLHAIGYDAFYNSALTGVLVITDQINIIENGAFYGCAELTEIHVGTGVEVLSSNAFAGCSNVKNLVFESGSKVKIIQSLAFAFMSKLTKITLPESLEQLYVDVFAYCSGLSEIDFLEQEPPDLVLSGNADQFTFGTEKYQTKIKVPDGDEEKYISKWKDTFETNADGLSGEEMVRKYLGIVQEQ